MINDDLLDSAHDCADGGIAVALTEKTLSKGIGAKVKLSSAGIFPEHVLFGEDPSRIVFSCDQQNLGRIKEVAGKHGVAADAIGETIPDKLEISLDGTIVVSIAISGLRDVYEGALENALKTDPELIRA